MKIRIANLLRNFLANLPMVKPCTIMENEAIIYVIEMNTSLNINVGKNKTSTSKMQPLKPSHFKIVIAFFSKLFYILRFVSDNRIFY